MNLPWSREVSSQTHYLLVGDQVEKVAWPAPRAYLLVSRGDSFFFTVDVSGVPAAARHLYVEQQVRKRSPWSQSGHYATGIEKGLAAVWIWDQDRIDEVRGQLPAEIKGVRCLPEAVLLPAGSDGPVTQACVGGLDYQIWGAGRLLESRWCSGEMNEFEGDLYRRGADLSEELPAAGEAPDWLARPWTESELDWRSFLRDEPRAMLAGVALLLFVICVELGAITSLKIKTGAAESSILELQENLGERLQYRLEAERLHALNQEWAKLLPRYTQLEVVAEFIRLLEGQEFDLVDWEYREGALRVTLRNDQLDTRDTVARLESGSFFTDVRIQPGQREGEHSITLTVGGRGS